MKKAFTLIELLVVIAIIAILAAILFPVFGRARENARRSSCQSNLKQIGLAFAQYSQDYDERYPTVINNAPGGRTWDAGISPYLGQSASSADAGIGILKCPSDPGTRSNGRPTRSYSVPRGPNGICRATLTDPISGQPYRPMAALAELSAPATTLMLVEYPYSLPAGSENIVGNESGAQVDGPRSQSTCDGATTFSGCGQDRQYQNRGIHFDGWNYLFADGHVKWLLPNRTVGTIGGTSTNQSGASYTCGNLSTTGTGGPCGMWTILEND